MGKRRGTGSFVKVQKNKAYFKRYQVKYRRRREGKTDYYQRKKLVVQAKNKYDTHKYRLIVRKTNTQIICQVAYSTVAGDHVVAAAYSSELPKFGLKQGLCNYASAYCTGLLVGRRLLKKFKLDEMYLGVSGDDVNGEILSCEKDKRKFFVDEVSDEATHRPFRVFLDVGLSRTTLGAKIFGALKGASDAGLDVPHNFKKFPGYDKEEKTYDAAVHKEMIFGDSVAEYMRFLEQEDEESGTKRMEEQFKGYCENGVKADDLEDLLRSVHDKIRENPDLGVTARKPWTGEKQKFKNKGKDTLEQRKERVEAKRLKIQEMEVEDEEESQDEE